jgi:putative acetyltransferase
MSGGQRVAPARGPLVSGTLGRINKPPAPMKIDIDDLSRSEIHALLNEHLQSMHALSPPESVHALDLEQLRKPEITFWSAWEGSLLLGCGALKELDRKHGEVKSMRTPITLRRRGAGRAILAHIIEVARSRAYERLSLETGSAGAFKPAQQLYETFGFTHCGPFGEYVEDPNSVFMSLRLRQGAA